MQIKKYQEKSPSKFAFFRKESKIILVLYYKKITMSGIESSSWSSQEKTNVNKKRLETIEQKKSIDEKKAKEEIKHKFDDLKKLPKLPDETKEPVTKLPNWSIRFPYRYGRYECILTISKNTKWEVMIITDAKFDGKQKHAMKYTIRDIKDFKRFDEYISTILDVAVTKWRKSASEKSKQAFNLLFPNKRKEELDTMDHEYTINKTNKSVSMELEFNGLSTKKRMDLNIQYNPATKKIDVSANIKSYTGMDAFNRDSNSDFVLSLAPNKLTSIWTIIQDKLFQWIPFTDNAWNRYNLIVEDRNTLDDVLRKISTATEHLSYYL